MTIITLQMARFLLNARQMRNRGETLVPRVPAARLVDAVASA